jgi:hypothetical protein
MIMNAIATSWAVVAVALVGSALPGAAQAGDLGGTASSGAPAASKVNQDINRAVSGESSTSSPDIDSRINDLEATRAAIDEKNPPAVSLSVSGWVVQQTQIVK